MSRSNVISITIIGVLFFIFGFVTWLNGTLIPFLKISCELNNTEAYLVTFAFYISYFVMALPSSAILHRTGFKGGMSMGLAVMSIGTLFFLPAAYSRSFGLFLAGLFIQGTGLSLLQTASNPYVTIIGPLESAAKRISIMGICNKIAGVISPLILGAIILKNVDPIQTELSLITDNMQREILLNRMAERIVLPYIIMALVLVFLSILVKLSPLPDIDTDNNNDIDSTLSRDKKSIFEFPHLLLGFVAIFLYVGAEVIAGDTIILYGKSLNIPLDNNISVEGMNLWQKFIVFINSFIYMDSAKVFTSYTMLAMVVGYIIGIITIPKYIKQEKALMISAVAGLIFTVFSLTTSGKTSVFFIAILGLSNAIMWPAIWPLAIKGLGKFTKTGSAILIMGIAGGAILPLIYGKFADITSIGNQKAYLLLIPCYLFIFYYAISGHKTNIKS